MDNYREKMRSLLGVNEQFKDEHNADSGAGKGQLILAQGSALGMRRREYCGLLALA